MLILHFRSDVDFGDLYHRNVRHLRSCARTAKFKYQMFLVLFGLAGIEFHTTLLDATQSILCGALGS